MPPERSDSVVAVSDGKQISLLWPAKKTVWRTPLSSPDALGAEVRSAGFKDWTGTLHWILTGPGRDGWQQARYIGRRTVDGEEVEVLELEKATTGADPKYPDNPVRHRTVTRFGLGKDGLPRFSEQRQSWRVDGTPPGQQPADWIVTARYRQTQVDREPPQGTFTLVVPSGITETGG